MIGGAGLFGLLLLATASAPSPASALAVNNPAGGSAIKTTIAPPLGEQPPVVELPAGRVPVGNPLWAVPLRSLNVTRERPLFSPSRRPPAAAVVAVPSRPPAPKPARPDHPLLTLLGTVVGKQQGIAIFVDQASKTVITLETGQEHDGWTLRAVQDRKTVFERDQRQAILALPARGTTTDQPPVPGFNSASALPTGTWRDGDGQMINPPASAGNGADAQQSSPGTWRDGDGQMIAPPPTHLSNIGQR